MARITHPDTFKCDLCGEEMSEDEVNRIVAPFTSRYVATDHGLKLKDVFTVRTREFDLCDACAYRVVLIDEIPKFCQEPDFAFREEE